MDDVLADVFWEVLRFRLVLDRRKDILGVNEVVLSG